MVVHTSTQLEEVESMAKKTKKVEDPNKKIKKGKKEKDNRR
jgi:hypothetical protein